MLSSVSHRVSELRACVSGVAGMRVGGVASRLVPAALSPALPHATRGVTTSSTPGQLLEEMAANGVTRGAVYRSESGEVKATHEMLEPCREWLVADSPDYDGHEGMFMEVGQESGALLTAFLWWTHRGAGCGGVRLRPYETIDDLFTDGLRLSLGMGRKSALAGLWWGGGKGVIAQPDISEETLHSREWRDALFRDYGRFVTGMNGIYVAAEDAGVNVADIDVIFQKTRYLTCISPHLGGSGNPSVATAAGVVAGMEGALDFAGMGTLEGKSVALKGVGNVGRPMVKYLLEKGAARVVGVEALEANLALAREELSKLDGYDRVELRSIHDGKRVWEEDVDIVAPCSFGAVLNPETIPMIRAKIVCGAANSQLEDEARDDAALAERGILYCPDFVVNRMGIVNCANEQYGRVGSAPEDDDAIARHFSRDWENSVFQVTKRVLQYARDNNTTPGVAARKLADAVAVEPHPIWGNRTRTIIAANMAANWAASPRVEV